MPEIYYNKSASRGVLSTSCLPNHNRHWRAKMDNADLTPIGGNSQHIDTEIWKPVPSERGMLASSHGRVLLPPSFAPLHHGGYRAYTPKPRLGQIAKVNKNAKHQYKIVMVKRTEGNRQSPRKVHQLVCEAFHGPKPFDGAVVMHLDENALNNRPENLKWGTQKENMNAKGFIEYCKSRSGENSPYAKGMGATA